MADRLAGKRILVTQAGQYMGPATGVLSTGTDGQTVIRGVVETPSTGGAPRHGTAREDAMLALFLASAESNFIVGQALPFAGGWVQR